MRYLLDTNIVSEMMRRNPNIQNFINELPISDRVIVCTVTRGEILYGLERLPHGKRRRNLEKEAMHIFSQFPCFSIPEGAADHYARIKREAERKGTPLDENDLWIAACGLSLGATVVTADSDFQRVSKLPVVDWTKEA